MPDIVNRAPEASSRRGEARRRVGWVGGVHPSAPFKARTAASDGHTAYTRAARSAGLRFAVRSLAEAMDRERSKSGARVGTSSTADAVPLPLVGEGLIARKSGRDLQCRARHSHNCGERSVAALPDCGRMLPFTSALRPSPGRGRGTAVAVDEVMRRN